MLFFHFSYIFKQTRQYLLATNWFCPWGQKLNVVDNWKSKILVLSHWEWQPRRIHFFVKLLNHKTDHITDCWITTKTVSKNHRKLLSTNQRQADPREPHPTPSHWHARK
jgi:hypothetical protein